MKNLDLPPVWTILAIVLTVVIGKFGPEFGYKSQIGSAVLILGGIALGIWTALTFRKGQTSIHPGHTPDALLTSGPFKFSRNPIYTGMMLITIGIALFYGGFLGFLPALGLFFILDRKFARPEEALLIKTFGQDAKDYVAAVRRW